MHDYNENEEQLGFSDHSHLSIEERYRLLDQIRYLSRLEKGVSVQERAQTLKSLKAYYEQEFGQQQW